MILVVCFALTILPVSAIAYGVFLGLFDEIVPDVNGVLVLNENGETELRIL